MIDIVQRLRTTITNSLQVSAGEDVPHLYPNCADAADEIERLRKALDVSKSDCAEAFGENEHLRALNAEMREVIDELIPYARATIGAPEPSWQPDNVILKARAILAKTEDAKC